MKCTACETDNANDARFCKQCGAALAITAPLACVACGAVYTASAVFCAACGHKHGQPIPALPSVPSRTRWVGLGFVLVLLLLGYMLYSGSKKAALLEGADSIIPPEAASKSGQKAKAKSNTAQSVPPATTPNNPNFVRELEACKAKGFFERGICTEQVQWKHCTVNGVWDTTKPGCER